MKTVYFITHPNVVIDPEMPAPQWPLSQRGIERIRNMLHQPWIEHIEAVYCSSEQKAVDGAQILADYLGIAYQIREKLGEVDRSSTGFLPEEAFWPVVNQLYDNPDESIQGWESASAAQQRIGEAIDAVIKENENDGNIAIIAHGLVGALHLGHLRGVSICRELEQPSTNGGNYYAFHAETNELLHDWQPIDVAQKDDENLRHCPNPDCRFRADTGMIAEFQEEIKECPDCGTALAVGEAPPSFKQKTIQSSLWKASELLATVGSFESEEEAYEGKEELSSFGIMSIVVESELPEVESDIIEEIGNNSEEISEVREPLFVLQVARFDLRRAYEILGVPDESDYQIDDDYWDELEKAGLYGGEEDGDLAKTEIEQNEDEIDTIDSENNTNQMLMIVGVILLFVIVGFLYTMFS